MEHVKIVGLKKLDADMDSAARRFPEEMKRKIRKASSIVVGAAQKQFVGSRTRLRFKIKGGEVVSRSRKERLKFVQAKTKSGKRKFTRAKRTKLSVFEGTYRKQISYTVRGAKRKLNSEVGPVGIPYARIHEFGGTIRPKGKFLRFIGSDGAPVFVKSVKIPARPVLTPAVQESTPDVFRILGQTFKVVK